MEFEHRLEKSSQSGPFQTYRPMSGLTGNHEWRTDQSSQHDPVTAERTVDPAALQCRLDLMSHWADEPDHRPARSKAQKANPPRSGFDQLTSGEHGHSISMRKAPSQVVLPQEMTQAMRVAWNQSLPMGDAQEQGGLLVRNQDGSLKWLRSNPGNSREIKLNYRGVNPHQRLLASGHTHPYDKGEHNFTNVPFSGRDLAEHVFENQRLSVVQSGEGMFGSARTKEFDEMVNARDELGQLALSEEIEKFWQSYYDNADGDTPEKAEAATRATSDWYHLLYYTGKQGVLRRVDTSPKPEAGGK